MQQQLHLLAEFQHSGKVDIAAYKLVGTCQWGAVVTHIPRNPTAASIARLDRDRTMLMGGSRILGRTWGM